MSVCLTFIYTTGYKVSCRLWDCVFSLLTSQGLPWSQISSWYHRHAFSKIHRQTRRFLSPFLTGVEVLLLMVVVGERFEEKMRLGWRSGRLTQPKKKEEEREVVHLCISPKGPWLVVSADCLASLAHAGSQASPRRGDLSYPERLFD